MQATNEQATLTDTNQIKRYSEQIQVANAQLKALIAPFEEIRKVGAIEAQEQQIKILSATLKTVGKNDIPAVNKELEKAQTRLKELKDLGKTRIIDPIREVGAIEAIEKRISILKNTIKTVPKENIVAIRSEIVRAEDELKRLLGEEKQVSASGGGGGLLANLFGVSTGLGAGKQVLKGALAGLGIGVGFSILPAITSSIIEYTAKLLDARSAEFAAKEGVDALNSTLTQQLAAFTALNKSISEAFGGLNTFDAAVQRSTAIGIENGKIYEARVRQFDAEQEARNAEISELLEQEAVYRRLRNALLDYDKGKNLGRLNQDIKNIGLSSVELARAQKAIKETFERINDLPRAQRNRALRNLRLSENDELVKLAADNASKINALEEQNSIKKLAFEKQTQREIFDLNIQLQKQLRASDQSFEQEQFNRRETTAESIKKSIKSSVDFQVN
jgi:hypothetical protein